MKLYLHICKSADRSPPWIPALGRALKAYCLLRYSGKSCSFLSIYLSLSAMRVSFYQGADLLFPGFIVLSPSA